MNTTKNKKGNKINKNPDTNVDIFKSLSDIIQTPENIGTERLINEFTNLIAVYNFIALKLLFKLKKILDKSSDNQAVANILHTVYSIPENKITKLTAVLNNMPNFIKEEDLLSSAVSTSDLIDIFSDKNNIKYEKYIKYSVSDEGRIEKELESKDRVIAKLMSLYMELLNEKEENNG